MRRLTLGLIGLGFSIASIAAWGAGCEAGADDQAGGGNDGDGDGAGNSNGATNPDGSTGEGFATGTTTGGVGGGCAGISVGADKVPLDMYIMLDQSGSMSDPANGGGTRWQAVQAAFNTFVNQPEAAGIGIGIQYFPLDSGVACNVLMCTSDAQCGAPGCGPCQIQFGFGVCPGFGASDSCEPNDYATPDVPIAELPGNAAAITASIAAHGPTNNTPTLPALQGAIAQAQSFAAAHPGHQVIVVLATDGEPNVCGSDVNTVSAAAAAGLAGTPSILTFVIGVGASPQTCNAIAAAGGTDQAFLVDQDPNVQQAFLDALNQIQGIALPCSYLIPEPTMGEINFNQVNVQYTPDGGSPETLPRVDSAAECPPGGNAWYYDNNANPTQIILCPDTCSALSAGDNGEVNIVLGCDTVVQ